VKLNPKRQVALRSEFATGAGEASNPMEHQPQILFVCSAGRIRSRTAELLAFLGGYPRDADGSHRVMFMCRSVGIDESCPSPMTINGVVDAEITVCMESTHANAILMLPAPRLVRVVTLGIPDKYVPFQAALVNRLVAGLKRNDLRVVADAIAQGYKLYKTGVA
jgi:predicted protein tyrosine phosphatase